MNGIKTGVVSSFRGDYAFLSNYYTSTFEWRGETFKSGEQAFAYAKTFYSTGPDTSDLAKKILNADSPGAAKRLGRVAPLDLTVWDGGHKVQIMREIVHAKFMTSEENLAGPLINTGAMMLVEGNDWGDTFWGRCKNADGKIVGLNTLGVILMEERGYWLRGRSD